MIYCAPSTQSQLPKKKNAPIHHHPTAYSLQQSLSLQRRLIGKIHASRNKKIKEVIKAAGGIYKGAPHTPTVPQPEGYFASRYWHHWRAVFFFCLFFFLFFVVFFSHPNFSKLTKQLWWSIWMMKWMSTHSGKAGQPTQILWSKTRVISQRKESLSLDHICLSEQTPPACPTPTKTKKMVIGHPEKANSKSLFPSLCENGKNLRIELKLPYLSWIYRQQINAWAIGCLSCWFRFPSLGPGWIRLQQDGTKGNA